MNEIILTCASFFAGIGGSLTGFLLAGFKHHLFAVELADEPLNILKLNYPGLKIFRDIRELAKMSADELLKTLGVKAGELWVADFSPPCQMFSLSGLRIFLHELNFLYEAVARMLEVLQPKVFVMENVPGMYQGEMEWHFARAIELFEKAGYVVDYQVMNACLYGQVPQARERIIVIGVHKSLKKLPSFPKDTGVVTTVSSLLPHIKAFTVGQSNKKTISSDNPCGTITRSADFNVIYEWDWETGDLSKPHIEDLRVLGGFPDDFDLGDNYNRACEGIGNSVPPKFMEKIARHIKEEILGVKDDEDIAA